MKSVEITLREWQRQKFDEALNALKTKKTLLLNVTTGAGKTLFALLLGKTLQKKILFLTRTHSEFEAVRREAERLGLKVTYLFGKNSVCPYATDDVKPEDIQCKECSLKDKVKDLSGLRPSQILQLSKTASDFCPYHSLRTLISKSDVIVASYMYFFNPILRRKIICSSPDCIKPGELLVIVDEAHNLISADEWFSKKIGKRTINKALEEIEEVENKTNNDLTIARNFLGELSRFLLNISDEGGCKELPLYPKPSGEALLQIHMASLSYLNMIKGPIKRSYLRSIYDFYNTEGETFNCNGSLTIVPLNFLEMIKSSFNFADMRILMSGTLPNLGLEGHKIDVQARFGKYEFYYCDSINSKVKYRSTNAEKYAEIIKKVYSNSSSNVLVFFPSYDFKDKVKKYLTDLPTLEESKRITHEEILELMKGGKYIVLLVMRAKESEGVEFRDETNKNLFNDMILAGLPYPDISDALVRRRIKRLSESTERSEEEVAHELTLITIRQTIGRALRSENDFVRIYLCDSRYKEYFPTTPFRTFPTS
jgi:Rad3-related DNA helicase